MPKKAGTKTTRVSKAKPMTTQQGKGIMDELKKVGRWVKSQQAISKGIRAFSPLINEIAPGSTRFTSKAADGFASIGLGFNPVGGSLRLAGGGRKKRSPKKK